MPLLRVRVGTILALLVLITTIPLGLFAGYLIFASWKQQLVLVNRQNVERARAVSVAVDQEVQNTITALNVLAKVDPINAQDLRPFYDLASELVPLHAGWQAVRLVDLSSQVVLNTAVPFGEPSSLTSDDWIQKVRDTGRPVASAAHKDPVTGQLFVTVAVPVHTRRERTLRFVLGVRLSLSKFSDVLRQQTSPPGGVVALIDNDYKIIARTRNEERWIMGSPTPEFLESIKAAPEGSVESRMLEGTQSYSAHSRSSLTGWTVALGLPAETVNGPLRASLWALVPAAILVVGSGLGLALLVRLSLVRAQVAAVAAAGALARSESLELQESAVIEFNELANGLREAKAILEQRLHERDEAERARNEAARQLELALQNEQAARAAGERNEARLSVTLRSIGDAVIATDAQGLVTVLNPVAQALTGWPESEAIGRPIDMVFETVDEHSRRPNPSPLDRVAATTQATPISSHTILMARDGRDIPIGDSAAAIRAQDGTLLGIVVVFRNMTAERDAERHRAATLEREQAARRAAEALSRAKDEFVATVSHELRTPLNAIYGWVAMLKLGTLDESGRAKALEVIDRNTRVQAQLIEDLLDMARVIRGTVRLEMQPLDLATVLEAAADSVRPAADARRVRLMTHAQRGIALVSGDSSRLQQIFWNLLSNSIKFCEAGDGVDVSVVVEGEEAVVRVCDTGTGIDPAFLPYVFDRFRQETSDVTREHAGLGLGLSLVRHLAELHGGTVAAESGGKDQGATFTVRLPLLGARGGQQREPDLPESRLAELLPDALHGLEILVVDDDPDGRELIVTALQHAGARVNSAASVAETIAALDSMQPDAVITDIAMPHATGFDLVRQLRENPRWTTIPIVAVTAYARPEDRTRAIAMGFSAHVGKPFSPRALVAIVADLARKVQGA